jgi:hypothetical protein
VSIIAKNGLQIYALYYEIKKKTMLFCNFSQSERQILEILFYLVEKLLE